MNKKNHFNPSIHHRKSIRLKGYDYAQPGAYFITICTHQKECMFGNVVSGEMVLNEFGKIAMNHWRLLGDRFPNTFIDEYVIMPNHMHGIIIINEPEYSYPTVGAGFTPVQNGVGPNQQGQPQGLRPTDNDDRKFQIEQPRGLPLGDIVGAYKSLVFKECLALSKNQGKYLGKLWQRNYFEHIVRNETAYQKIIEYIQNNPAQWELDKYFAQTR